MGYNIQLWKSALCDIKPVWFWDWFLPPYKYIKGLTKYKQMAKYAIVSSDLYRFHVMFL